MHDENLYKRFEDLENWEAVADYLYSDLSRVNRASHPQSPGSTLYSKRRFVPPFVRYSEGRMFGRGETRVSSVSKDLPIVLVERGNKEERRLGGLYGETSELVRFGKMTVDPKGR